MSILLMILAIVAPGLVVGLVSYLQYRIAYKPKRPEKITSGPFKGKLLWYGYEQDAAEYEVFTNPIENIIAEINAKTPSMLGVTCGSTLAQSTINRLDAEIDPKCFCGKGHRASGHSEYKAYLNKIKTKLNNHSYDMIKACGCSALHSGHRTNCDIWERNQKIGYNKYD